jgi:Flp pilus assembly protein TadD
MNRLLATTAAAALCAAWMVATPVWADDDDVAPAPAADVQPKTLQDAIDIQVAAAKTLRQQGRVDEAAKAFSQLMLVAPDNPALLAEYGKALAQQGHSQDAVVLLTHAVQLQTGDWTYYSALGVAYDQLGKRKEARESYDRALALKPGEPSVLNNYALSRMLAGDYAGAQKMFEQVQAMGSNDPKLAENLAKLAALQAAHAPKPAAVVVSAPAAHADVAVAEIPAPATQAPVAVAAVPTGGVMMQRVPVDPLAGPIGKATHAPVSLAAKAAPKPLVNAQPVMAPAKVAEKIDPATTMMQNVPVDPLAGPVKPHVVAAVAPKKPAAKPVTAPVKVAAKPADKSKTVVAKAALSAPPTLRTASDTN